MIIENSTDLVNAILLDVSRGPARAFRMNCGVAWQGRIIEHTRERLVLSHPYAIHLGPGGFADIFGWVLMRSSARPRSSMDQGERIAIRENSSNSCVLAAVALA